MTLDDPEEQWVTRNGRQVTLKVDADALVQVSIELLRQMFTDLGLTCKEDA